VPHPELGDVITYPGAFVKSSETVCQIRRPAPLIGEHNQEILQKELAKTKKIPSIVKTIESFSPSVGNKQALDGIRVVDFTWVAAGPLVTRYLAAHGAEVVKMDCLIRNKTKNISKVIRGCQQENPYILL